MIRLALPALLLCPLLLGARTYDLPGPGVRIQIDSRLAPRPLKPPPVRVRQKDHAKLVSGNLFWLYRQTCGFWSSGTRHCTLWEPRFAPYGGPLSGTEAECEKSFLPFPADQGRTQALAAWLAAAGFPRVTFRNAQRNAAVEIREAKVSARQYVFAVRSCTEERLLLLSCEFSSPPADAELAAIRKDLLAADFRPVQQKRLSGDRIGRATAETLHVPGWWKSQSSGYLFLSNVTDRSRIRKIQQDLERARSVFTLYLPLPEVREPGVVKLFAKREEYVAYAGQEMAWSAGFWDPGRRELVISPLDGRASSTMQEKFMRNVLFHEGFHQYLFHGMGDKNVPCWFNEGCAQFFEECIVRGGKRVVSLSEGRIRLARQAVRSAQSIDLMQFCRLDHNAFYADPGRDFNYAFSHALLYYLLQAAPAEKKNAFAAIPGRYLEAWRTTDSPEEALKRAFAGIDAGALKKDLIQFWESPKRIRSASKYVPRRRK